MPRSKNNWNQKPAKDKDGKHRKETKEERKARLKRQDEAREMCLRNLPKAAAVVLVFVFLFGILVSFIISQKSSSNENYGPTVIFEDNNIIINTNDGACMEEDLNTNVGVACMIEDMDAHGGVTFMVEDLNANGVVTCMMEDPGGLGIEITSSGSPPPPPDRVVEKITPREVAKAPTLSDEVVGTGSSECMKNADCVLHPQSVAIPDPGFRRSSQKKSWVQSLERNDGSAPRSAPHLSGKATGL